MIPLTNWKFNIGDRVKRVEDPFKPIKVWKYKHGFVFARYQRKSKQFGFYPELYWVKFDDGKYGRAFLRHGLDRE